MAIILNGAPENENNDKNNDRTSQSSVRDMKVRRSDVGYMDPIAKKLSVNNEYYFSAKNLCAVSPDELDKTAIKSRVWGWERTAKTWLEGKEGKAAIEAIKNGTYEFDDPEHDYLWETKAGMLALGTDIREVAFYEEAYKRFRPRPDFDKVYTPEHFNMFFDDYYCRKLMVEAFCEAKGLNDEARANFDRVLRYSSREGFAQAYDAVHEWYKEGGNRYFGAYHYAKTITNIKDYIFSCGSYEKLVEMFNPQYFIDRNMCGAESNEIMYKHHSGVRVRRLPINEIYQGVINSDMVSLAAEISFDPDYYVNRTDKEGARLQKALKTAPIYKIDDIELAIDADANVPYVMLDVGAEKPVRFELTIDQMNDLNYAFADSYVVFDVNSKSIAFNIMDEKIANNWSVAFYENHNALVRQRAQGYVPYFNLTDLTRIGPMYREGSIASEQNLQGESYETKKGAKVLSYQGEALEFCHLKGVTFGNTTALNARTAFVNNIYDGFRDIENVFHTKSESMFGENLAISYGASGRPPELAHMLYDRANDMYSVNVTYKKGYGSVGHELFHVFDGHIGSLILKEASLRSNLSPIEAPMLTENFAHANEEWKDALKANFPAAYAVAEFINDHNTSFFKRSFKLENPESDNLYWSTPREMFARAAAVYAMDKFREAGYRNDFLNGNAIITAKNADGKIVNPIPNKEEQKIFNGLMDNFLAEVKERGLVIDCPENMKSLYCDRHPGEQDKYNVIFKTETYPLLHMFEKRARAEKNSVKGLVINGFSSADLENCKRYVEAALPEYNSEKESIDTQKFKTIIISKDELSDKKVFAFSEDKPEVVKQRYEAMSER